MTVEITLNGKPETLKCTLRAAKTVNAMGGFAEAFRLLAAFDINAYAIVVAAGLNKKPSDVEEAVYEAGMPGLTEPLSKFVGMLANGGRSIDEKQEPGTGEA